MELTKSAQNMTDEVSLKHGFKVVNGTDEVSNHIRQGDIDVI
ncbi:hypothetical protein [Streptococcus pneumoniae]|nr:hypothetical protein [Streptococcus pneumoniae]